MPAAASAAAQQREGRRASNLEREIEEARAEGRAEEARREAETLAALQAKGFEGFSPHKSGAPAPAGGSLRWAGRDDAVLAEVVGDALQTLVAREAGVPPAPPPSS